MKSGPKVRKFLCDAKVWPLEHHADTADRLLKAGLTDSKQVDRIARLIHREWKVSDVSLKYLKILSDIFNVETDVLIGISATDKGALELLLSFLENCHNLACYVVSVPTAYLEKWQVEASSLAAGDLEGRMKLAEKCAPHFQVLGMSPLFRQKHNLEAVSTKDEIEKRNMSLFMNQRMEWIRNVRVHGQMLFERARREALSVIYNVVQETSNKKFTWYPCCMDGNLEHEESIQVTYDELRFPLKKDHRCWMLHYHFGKKLSAEVFEVLIDPNAP